LLLASLFAAASSFVTVGAFIIRQRPCFLQLAPFSESICIPS